MKNLFISFCLLFSFSCFGQNAHPYLGGEVQCKTISERYEAAKTSLEIALAMQDSIIQNLKAEIIKIHPGNKYNIANNIANRVEQLIRNKDRLFLKYMELREEYKVCEKEAPGLL